MSAIWKNAVKMCWSFRIPLSVAVRARPPGATPQVRLHEANQQWPQSKRKKRLDRKMPVCIKTKVEALSANTPDILKTDLVVSSPAPTRFWSRHSPTATATRTLPR